MGLVDGEVLDNPSNILLLEETTETSRAQQFHGCLKKSVSLAILLQMLNCFSPKVEMKRRVLARGGALHYARGPICASGSKSLWSEGNCFQSSVLPSLPSALQQDICYARQ